MAKIAYFVRVWTFSCNLCNGFDYYLTASTHETQFRGLTLDPAASFLLAKVRPRNLLRPGMAKA